MDSQVLEAPQSLRPSRLVSLGSDPEWYKDAVIYQLHVKAYLDSTGDGIGDFAGLMQRLDYIQSLGATAIWLLPFYPSPLRDDGYDIADYRRINPAYGNMRDFRQFVKEAHRRGLRVITELVINHTSDQHPWFQKARRSKPGSAARNFYVWSDTDQRYQGTRIIFLDTEKSNWTWDPVANAYFWHRFYSHQPDLNFDNPRVLEEVIKTMRYWLDMGVDGLRLDAIPYLVERDGTNNENLPETHEVLKKIRAALDEVYDDRMLLAEANQWPEDTAPYFGDGDECHMAFHFPLMPRMYMAVAQEDRHPVTDIIRQMPDIPDPCQWAIFLRNHDELTLEMVTEEERDYLWRTYAADARARINLGIRRRLAPLMQNDRRKIELMNGLLLSMPGTPIIYYGDEIGMGDNYFLGDRDGVRTPMQWTPDRNGGFSRANPQQLYLPPVMDAIYGFEAVNVEAEEIDPSSLLNWMRRILAVRMRHRAFGRGQIRFLYPANRKILVYVREFENERILCVANLSRAAQAVELDLSQFRGAVPVELADRTPFPPIGDLPYLLTLPGYGFFWFILEEQAELPRWHQVVPEILPDFITLTATDGTIGSVLSGRERRQLEQDILPKFLPLQRWYGDKQLAISSVSIKQLRTNIDRGRAMCIVEVHSNKVTHRYFLPLVIHWGEDALRVGAPLLSHTLAKVRKGPRIGALIDGAFDDQFAIDLMRAIQKGEATQVEGGKVQFDVTDVLGQSARPEVVRRLSGEQSNVSVIIDDHIMLKIYRRLQSGIQPDVEVGRFLSETAGFANTPAYLGSATFRSSQGEAHTLATAFAFVPNQGDAWSTLLDALTRHLETWVLTATPDPDAASEPFAYPLDLAATLGQRTAQLHAALATATSDRAFSVVPIRASDLKSWAKATASEANKCFTALRRMVKSVPAEVASDISVLLAAKTDLMRRIAAVESLEPSGGKSRIHGDYHLGQVLICENDVMIVDFEGEPQRVLNQRRTKSSPLRDVAGMLRSFDYLAWSALDHRRHVAGELREAEIQRAVLWRDGAIDGFLRAYVEAASQIPTYPGEAKTAESLLQLFTIQKAVYEIGYEAANRPGWLSIPVRGLLDILNRKETTS
ncbi:MAG: maltose alpha-D-glucosyltransferase [Burkholderiales bacterium]|jgi:maltose alpha-D-glucosyltransferase/alpha-amylase